MHPSIPPLNRPFTRLLGCAASLLCGLSGILSYAESDYVGSWELTTPDQEGLHLIVKANGTAGYFWTDTAENQIYPGVWTADSEGIELLWENESRHVFSQQAESTQIDHYSASGKQVYSVKGTRIAKGVLGAWYQAPRDDHQASKVSNGQYESLQGNWDLSDNRVLSILDDRVARLNSVTGQPEQRGRWTRKEQAIEIIWNTGDYSRLQQKGSDYIYTHIAATQPIHEASPTTQPITRNYSDLAKVSPSEDHLTSLSFDSRKEQIKFFQGTWILERSASEYERISIGRFGGVRSDRKYQLNGQWKTAQDGLDFTWDDGMRGQLLKIADAFIYLEYAAGRPLDGIPNRILKVAPIQLDRLSDSSQVAQQQAASIVAAASQYPTNPAKPTQPAQARNKAPRWWPLWTYPAPKEAAEPALIPEPVTEHPARKKSWVWPF